MAEPGWYPDPNDPEGTRWWDGTQWTDDTRGEPDAGRRWVLFGAGAVALLLLIGAVAALVTGGPTEDTSPPSPSTSTPTTEPSRSTTTRPAPTSTMSEAQLCQSMLTDEQCRAMGKIPTPPTSGSLMIRDNDLEPPLPAGQPCTGSDFGAGFSDLVPSTPVEVLTDENDVLASTTLGPGVVSPDGRSCNFKFSIAFPPTPAVLSASYRFWIGVDGKRVAEVVQRTELDEPGLLDFVLGDNPFEGVMSQLTGP